MSDFDWENPFSYKDFIKLSFLQFDLNADKRAEQHVADLARDIAQYHAATEIAERCNARFREIVKEHGKRVWLSDFGNKGDYWTDRRKAIENPSREAILVC